MSALTNGRRLRHPADGARAAFAYGFRVLDDAHLTVAPREAGTGAETAQLLNTHDTDTAIRWLPVSAGDWFDAHLDPTSFSPFDLLANGGTWVQAGFV